MGMTRKPLSPAAVVNLNRVLRRVAEDLERRKAEREAAQHTEKLAREVTELCDDLARAE